MKFLGLMGVLLWLGTLLGTAGGADRSRLSCALLEKEIAGVDLSPTAGAAKCEAGKKSFDDGFLFTGHETAELAAPGVFSVAARVDPTGEHAARAPRVEWHFGQGPPSALRS